MTHPSDIAGLSDLLHDLREGPMSFHDARTKMHRAATQLDSLSARVKELEANQERLWCSACGTVTRDRRCDCNRYGPSHEMYREPHFHNYADGLSADLEKVQTELDEAESRATRAEQQRDEAYERAANVADEISDRLATQWRSAHKSSPHMEGMSDGADAVAFAIRRLASGPEGGSVKMEGK